MEAVVVAVVSDNIYVFNNINYPIEIIRKNNKNTYIRIKNNTIVVTTNYFTSINKIQKLINDNKEFINNGLLKCTNKNKDTAFKLFGKQ